MKTDKKRALPPAEAADRLIAAHDGDVALLYLYITRRGFDTEAAASALCRTAGEIGAAAEKLRRMGLLTAADDDPERLLPPGDELPEYSTGDLVRFAAEDPRLQTIYAEAAQVFGRKLSPSDMKMLAGVYRHLGLPAEVLLLLLNDCAARAARRRPGGVPSPRSVEKEAYEWANNEIMTLEQAEAFLNAREERRAQADRVREALNIRGRELTKTERDYIASWLGLGFSPEAIAIAYDRTVTNTGALRWPYMNKILLSWHERRLHAPEEIEAADSRRRPAPNGGQPRVSKEDYEFPKDI